MALANILCKSLEFFFRRENEEGKKKEEAGRSKIALID